MIKHDIRSRQDVELMVNTFYDKVRQHHSIGPFFNEIITDWSEHLSKLADFWETNLFFVKAYKGNPLRAHLSVDQHFNNEIEQAHFGHWLQLWFETLDDLFEGKNKELAKERARSMAHIMFLRIFQAKDHKEHLQIKP
ncbi:MAG: group III truncated hemoglobin [Reichenbachiella sp.]|uniref:group III truncated hemoglobin n=1 Tax=Reichenbachiella sp. TaxID=2184521 RepID=UPI003264FC11